MSPVCDGWMERWMDSLSHLGIMTYKKSHTSVSEHAKGKPPQLQVRPSLSKYSGSKRRSLGGKTSTVTTLWSGGGVKTLINTGLLIKAVSAAGVSA